MIYLPPVGVKGNSNNLMKVTSKRRRSRAQIALEKQEAIEKAAIIEKRLEQMDELEKKVKNMDQELQKADGGIKQLEQMFFEGQLKYENDGSITIVDNPMERKMLKLSN